MKIKKIISGLLSVVSVIGVFSSVGLLPVYAAGSKTEEEEVKVIDYYTEKFATPEAKLATMTLKQHNDNFELYLSLIHI